jgi:hypothetical protein
MIYFDNAHCGARNTNTALFPLSSPSEVCIIPHHVHPPSEIFKIINIRGLN